MIQFNDLAGVRIVDENNRGKANGRNILRRKFLKFEKYSGLKVLKDSFKHGKY